MEKKKEKVSFIPCLTWVRRGVAEPELMKVTPSKDELLEIMKQMKLREAEFKGRPKEEQAEASRSAAADRDSDNSVDDEENKDVDDFYDMDNYDDEGVGPPGLSMDLNTMINHTDSDNDSPDTDEEPDDFTVKADDNLILCGHVDGTMCMLEVYVFNNDKAELFLWNDFFLPSYPICVEWLDFNPDTPDRHGSYGAVGMAEPEIMVWDLNVSGTLEPAFKLGAKSKKTMRHTDAVLDLAWHKGNRTALASGSADKTVVLWDMAKTEGVARISSFEEKVQSLKWHPVEIQSLLTGCCDGKVRLYDCRNPKYFKTWGFEGEIERVLWNEYDPLYYYATTDKGMVYYMDTRTTNPVWTLSAHDKEVTGICLSSHCKDMLVTASMDETVKVWDVENNAPTLVTQKSMNISKIYTIASCPDVPYVFCAGGHRKDNHLYVWDSRDSDKMCERFKGRNFEEVPDRMDTAGEPQPSTSKGTGSAAVEGGKFTIGKRPGPATETQKLRAGEKKSRKTNKPKNKKAPKPSTSSGSNKKKKKGPPPP